MESAEIRLALDGMHLGTLEWLILCSARIQLAIAGVAQLG